MQNGFAKPKNHPNPLSLIFHSAFIIVNYALTNGMSFRRKQA